MSKPLVDSAEHRQAVKRRLDMLAGADLSAREQAWR